MPPERIRHYTITDKLAYYKALEAFWASVLRKYGDTYPRDRWMHDRFRAGLQRAQQEMKNE